MGSEKQTEQRSNSVACHSTCSTNNENRNENARRPTERYGKTAAKLEQCYRRVTGDHSCRNTRNSCIIQASAVWRAVCHKLCFILSRVWVTTDGIWIGNWIYWTLWVQCVTTVYSSLLHSRTSSRAHSSQGRNRSSSLTNWLTHQPTASTSLNWLSLTNCPASNISARTAHKTLFFCCCLRAVA
jgi:hypothetical protein